MNKIIAGVVASLLTASVGAGVGYTVADNYAQHDIDSLNTEIVKSEEKNKDLEELNKELGDVNVTLKEENRLLNTEKNSLSQEKTNLESINELLKAENTKLYYESAGIVNVLDIESSGLLSCRVIELASGNALLISKAEPYNVYHLDSQRSILKNVESDLNSNVAFSQNVNVGDKTLISSEFNYAGDKGVYLFDETALTFYKVAEGCVVSGVSGIYGYNSSSVDAYFVPYQLEWHGAYGSIYLDSKGCKVMPFTPANYANGGVRNFSVVSEDKILMLADVGDGFTLNIDMYELDINTRDVHLVKNFGDFRFDIDSLVDNKYAVIKSENNIYSLVNLVTGDVIELGNVYSNALTYNGKAMSFVIYDGKLVYRSNDDIVFYDFETSEKTSNSLTNDYISFIAYANVVGDYLALSGSGNNGVVFFSLKDFTIKAITDVPTSSFQNFVGLGDWYYGRSINDYNVYRFNITTLQYEKICWCSNLNPFKVEDGIVVINTGSAIRLYNELGENVSTIQMSNRVVLDNAYIASSDEGTYFVSKEDYSFKLLSDKNCYFDDFVLVDGGCLLLSDDTQNVGVMGYLDFETIEMDIIVETTDKLKSSIKDDYCFIFSNTYGLGAYRLSTKEYFKLSDNAYNFVTYGIQNVSRHSFGVIIETVNSNSPALLINEATMTIVEIPELIGKGLETVRENSEFALLQGQAYVYVYNKTTNKVEGYRYTSVKNGLYFYEIASAGDCSVVCMYEITDNYEFKMSVVTI